jgi:hypothetical protein
MRQVITTAGAVFLALFSAQVHAGTSAEGATESHLEQVLKAAGWTMTPERAATYGVGDIYKQGETDAVIYGTKCFEATPQTGKVEGFEIIKLLEGGLRLPLVGRIGLGTKKFKKQTFGEPYADKFDDMDLESISEKCRAWLLRRSDLSDLYLIKSVLMANMRERICEDKSVGVSTGGVGVEGRTSVDCISGTEGHVAVGYKLVSVREVLGMGGAVPTSTPAGPAPKPQSGVGQAEVRTGGSADYATLAAQAARAKAEAGADGEEGAASSGRAGGGAAAEGRRGAEGDSGQGERGLQEDPPAAGNGRDGGDPAHSAGVSQGVRDGGHHD